jgi:hypothetical protein
MTIYLPYVIWNTLYNMLDLGLSFETNKDINGAIEYGHNSVRNEATDVLKTPPTI